MASVFDAVSGSTVAECVSEDLAMEIARITAAERKREMIVRENNEQTFVPPPA